MRQAEAGAGGGDRPQPGPGQGTPGWGVTPPQSPKPLPEGHVQIPPREGEKDTQHRQQFRQLILYLKNNKQPDFYILKVGTR